MPSLKGRASCPQPPSVSEGQEEPMPPHASREPVSSRYYSLLSTHVGGRTSPPGQSMRAERGKRLRDQPQVTFSGHLQNHLKQPQGDFREEMSNTQVQDGQSQIKFQPSWISCVTLDRFLHLTLSLCATKVTRQAEQGLAWPEERDQHGTPGAETVSMRRGGSRPPKCAWTCQPRPHSPLRAQGKRGP